MIRGIKDRMPIFWIGIGLIAALVLAVVPYIANEQCEARWEHTRLEAYWHWRAGCVVKVGETLVREEYVTIGPTIKLHKPPDVPH
jgi:hypothetical protein